MRLLIVAATTFEIEMLLSYLDQRFEKINYLCYKRKETEIKICITGVGMMLTSFRVLESILEYKPQFALQVGVAGSFDKQLKLGDLVLVHSETMADLGAEDHFEFLDIFDLGLMQPDESVFKAKQLVNPIANQWNLPFVNAISVNAASGCAATIKMRQEKYECIIESMEGAAFHLVCLKYQIPFLQIRAISNYVEPRDKSKWEMKKAIHKLNNWIIQSNFLNGGIN